MKELDTLAKKGISKPGSYMLAALCLLLIVILPARAENTITSGTILRVSAGTTLVNVGTLTFKSGATISNLGTIQVSGNLDNQNVDSTDLGPGTFILNGSSVQNVNGINTFGNLSVNNPAGIALKGNTNINGVLTLVSGLITIGANNLLLLPSASVSGTPSSTAMVVATGSGEFRKSFASAGSFTFPVGDNMGTAEYSPVTLIFSGGSFGSGNYAGVSLANAAYPTSTGNYLNRYWAISQNAITGFTCDAIFQYQVADVIGSESQLFLVRVLPEPPVYLNAANTSLHQLTATGLTGFGTFTGAQLLAIKTLNLTLFLESLYDGGSIMRKAQNASGNQYAGTIADQVSIELHNTTIPYTLAGGPYIVNVNTDGTATFTVPSSLSSNYYIVAMHRNSIETWTGVPLSFSGSTVDYNFTTSASQAFGSNLKLISGKYVIYGGDVNQDGVVDAGDMIPVDNDAANFVSGYFSTDTNGDGSVDSADQTILQNNGALFIAKITPQ